LCFIVTDNDGKVSRGSGKKECSAESISHTGVAASKALLSVVALLSRASIRDKWAYLGGQVVLVVGLVLEGLGVL